MTTSRANHFFTILYQGADTGPAAIGLRYHLQDVGKIFDGCELMNVCYEDLSF